MTYNDGTFYPHLPPPIQPHLHSRLLHNQPNAWKHLIPEHLVIILLPHMNSPTHELTFCRNLKMRFWLQGQEEQHVQAWCALNRIHVQSLSYRHHVVYILDQRIRSVGPSLSAPSEHGMPWLASSGLQIYPSSTVSNLLTTFSPCTYVRNLTHKLRTLSLRYNREKSLTRIFSYVKVIRSNTRRPPQYPIQGFAAIGVIQWRNPR